MNLDVTTVDHIDWRNYLKTKENLLIESIKSELCPADAFLNTILHKVQQIFAMKIICFFDHVKKIDIESKESLLCQTMLLLDELHDYREIKQEGFANVYLCHRELRIHIQGAFENAKFNKEELEEILCDYKLSFSFDDRNFILRIKDKTWKS